MPASTATKCFSPTKAATSTRCGRSRSEPDRRRSGNLMSANDAFRIAVLPGDGIGHEVMGPCIAVLEAAARRVGGISFRFEEHQAGALTYRDTGIALPRTALDAAR